MGDVRELSDGFYWFLADRKHTGLYVDNWTLVEIKAGRVWRIGTDIDYSIEETKGRYERVREPQ